MSMSSAWDITMSVRPPRAVFVNFPLNHQTGKANDPALQRRLLLDALRAFETLWMPGQMLCLPYVWDANDRTWEDVDYGPNAVGYGVGRSVQDEFAEHTLGRATEDHA
jgi:hypothetical protein